MKQVIFAVACLFLLAGCQAKIVSLSFDQSASGNGTNVIVIDGSGAKFTTETDMNNDTKLPIALKGATAGTDGVDGVVSRYEPVVKTIIEQKAQDVVGEKKEPAEDLEAAPEATKEQGNYHGRTNGNRPTWYFSKNMNEYPKEFFFTVQGCGGLNIVNNGIRYDPHNGWLVKQSDVAGRGMSALAESSCKSTEAFISW